MKGMRTRGRGIIEFFYGDFTFNLPFYVRRSSSIIIRLSLNFLRLQTVCVYRLEIIKIAVLNDVVSKASTMTSEGQSQGQDFTAHATEGVWNGSLAQRPK